MLGGRETGKIPPETSPGGGRYSIIDQQFHALRTRQNLLKNPINECTNSANRTPASGAH